MREACRLIVKRAEAEEALLIADVARELSVSPSKLSRLFARHAGMTPKKYAVARRFDAFKRGARANSVVDAQFAAGFGSSSRLYEAARGYLGMTPGAYASRQGELIRYGFAASPVGRMLVAATERGLLPSRSRRVRERALEKRLKARFPNAGCARTRKRRPRRASLSSVLNAKGAAPDIRWTRAARRSAPGVGRAA